MNVRELNEGQIYLKVRGQKYMKVRQMYEGQGFCHNVSTQVVYH